MLSSFSARQKKRGPFLSRDFTSELEIPKRFQTGIVPLCPPVEHVSLFTHQGKPCMMIDCFKRKQRPSPLGPNLGYTENDTLFSFIHIQSTLKYRTDLEETPLNVLMDDQDPLFSTRGCNSQGRPPLSVAHQHTQGPTTDDGPGTGRALAPTESGTWFALAGG